MRKERSTPAGPTRIALVSLGCPKNLVDSEMLLANLAGRDCVVGAPVEQADVIVVNTCGFLESARQESLGVIGEALARKRQGKVHRVVVAGCLVNRDAQKLFELASGIDAIVGVNDRDRIAQAVLGEGEFESITPNAPAKSATPSPSDSGRFRLTQRHTAYVRISEGCSQRCTFCTIPAIRGPYRSKAPRAILKEARELISDGARELNLIGQDTTTYGRDLPGTPTLASLLRSLDGLKGVKWIRLMYAYPRRFTRELMETIAACPYVVKYIDLPLQHINDDVLRHMGRGVTRAATQKLLDELRTTIPGLVLRTTFIVGFPGETERQFRELLKFVEDFRFDALGVFEYSPEEGTPSASMPRQISAKAKAGRARQIMLAQQEIALAANRRRVGQEIEVLVDGQDAQGRCVGRYYGQAPEIDSVCYLRRPRPAGRFVKTKIVASDGYDLIVD